jgi:hypothetical protein
VNPAREKLLDTSLTMRIGKKMIFVFIRDCQVIGLRDTCSCRAFMNSPNQAGNQVYPPATHQSERSLASLHHC